MAYSAGHIYLGDYEGARKRFDRALKIFRDCLGENHPSTKTALNSLKSLYDKR